ncbi:MAG: DNA polymerase III subunit alpha [Candidatus Paceibacterota bacterium]
MKNNFVHLHVHSHYSLLDGLSKTHQIVNKAKEYKMSAIALTDHGNMYGAIEFYKNAKDKNIKPILGVEVYIAPNGMTSKGTKKDQERFHLILLAKNNTGWENLLKIVTDSNIEGFYYKPRIDREYLRKHSEGLICLSGCMSGEIGSFLKKENKEEAEETAKWYKQVFGDDYYLEIQPHGKEIHESILELSKRLDIPVVATNDSHYIDREDQTAHEILLAIQTNNELENKDRFSLKEFDISLRSPEEMIEEFKDIPEAIENTIKIAEKCNVEIELGVSKMPNFKIPKGETEISYLKKIIKKKLPEKYKRTTKEIIERIKQELEVIEKTGFANYFLIVADFVNWAKEHGIVVGPGRGSAAGSIVSYILDITDMDPIEYDLLFERFLNPARIQVPDIDIDIADTRRDEVIAYVREKYGNDHVAQIITFGTMMARASIRDTGRALGLSYGFCDEIAKLIPFNTSIEKAFKTVSELKEKYNNNPEVKNLIEAAKKLEGTVRHASVHACGIVIAPKPLTKYLPLQKAPQGGNSIITQFEMHSVEDLGILKMDFLGLRNLSIIEETLRLIKEYHQKEIKIDKIPLDNDETFKLFQRAETIGVFQLESSGMRRYLKELQPTELEDIIVMISLYRPGPMDLIPLYIRRKKGLEDITYLHPKLKPILSPTYGVGIYQEQMMRIARDLAGFSLAEADILRKAIGKKIKKLLDEQKEKLINGMKENGINEKTAQQVWELFPPFARYGFNRSHGASYAMISYQTAYLKANYPVEFITAWLKNIAGDMDRTNLLIQEAKHLDINVLPPNINQSSKNFAIDDDNNIRFGLLGVKNLGYNIVEEIIKERTNGGPYENLTNFLSRINHRDLNKKSIESLIKCGAFDSFGESRGKLLANIENIIKFNQASRKINQSDQSDLFGKSNHSDIKLEEAEPVDKKILLDWEKDLLGLYLTEHPFSYWSKKFKGKIKPIKELIGHDEDEGIEEKLIIGGIITKIQSVTTKKGDPMLFVTIEDETERLELLVFKKILSQTKEIWKEGTPIITTGRVSWRGSEPKILCNQVKKLK